MYLTAKQAEKERDALLLRNVEQALQYFREQENDAQRALARAVDQTKAAKDKYETVFAEVEKRACARCEATVGY